MLDLLRLFDTAFQQGCGQSLTTNLRSKRYVNQAKHYREARRSYRRQGEGNLVDMGLWEFATGINVLGETTTRAMTGPKQPAADPDLQALFEILGQQLIRSTKAYLPLVLSKAARTWNTLEADAQLACAQNFATILQKHFKATPNRFEPTCTIYDQREIDDWLAHTGQIDGVLGQQVIGRGSKRRLELWLAETGNSHKIIRDAYGCLPRQFTRGPAESNCIGLAVLLSAFACKTGANFMVCSYAQHVHTQPALADIVTPLEQVNALRASEAYFDPAKLVKADRALQQDLSQWSTNRIEDFHYALVIQLRDNTWALVDPYQSSTARLIPAYDADGAFATLGRYADLYPGLTIMGDDAGRQERELADINDIRRSAMAQAERLMAVMYENPGAPSIITRLADQRAGYRGPFNPYVYRPQLADLERAIRTSPEGAWYDWTSRQLLEDYDAPLEHCFLWADLLGFFSQFATASMKKHPTKVELVSQDFFSAVYQQCLGELADVPEAEMLRRLHDLFTLLAYDATADRNKAVFDGNQYTHPALEFMNPAYALGVAVVNSLRCWTNHPVGANVLLPYSASQQYWHEAADVGRTTAFGPELSRIETLVRELPHHYPIVQNKLDYLDRRRARA